MSWYFDRHERQWTIPLSITLPLILALGALAFWNEVEKKVSAGPQQCLSAAESESHACLVGSPKWIGEKWSIRGRQIDVAEAWWSHDFRYVRSGLFSSRETVDARAYLQISVTGTGLVQEHLSSPLDIRVDGRPAKIFLAESGSVFRSEFTEPRDSHLIEIRDGAKVLVSYQLETK